MKLKKMDKWDNIFNGIWCLLWCLFSGLAIVGFIFKFDQIKEESNLIQILISLEMVAASVCFIVNLMVVITQIIINHFFEEENNE